MKIYRDIAMIAVGATIGCMFEKYKKPIIDKMDCMMDDAIDKATDKLEKMK